MTITIYNFDNAGEYAFDASKIEVIGGKARLKDQRPSDATFGATYTNGINAAWGNGSLLCTPRGGAAAVNGKLDLRGLGKSVDYQALLNADSQQSGAIKLKIIPDWSGIGNKHGIFSICKGHNDSINRIQVMQWHNGQLIIIIQDSIAAVIINEYLPVWAPIQGQSYEFELNWDIDTGAGHGETRLFIDGVQHGDTLIGSGTRSADIGLLRVGCDVGYSFLIDGEIDDLIVFNTVQHTANYTPGYSVLDYFFPFDNPSIKPNAPIITDSINSFDATFIEHAGDTIKFTVEVDGVQKYWTGTAWSVSSGYAQSDTFAEIQANIGSIISIGSNIKFVAWLHSDIGETTPELDTIEIDHSYFAPTPGDPSLCIVAGYLRDASNNKILNAKIKATLELSYFVENKNFWIPNIVKEVVTDALGYFEIDLIWSSEFVVDCQYRFVAELESGEKYVIKTAIVPDLATVDFDELV